MFVSLEFKTMLFMSGLLAIALSLLLLAIHTRTAVINGLKHWVFANLCIGAAIIIFIQQPIPIPIRSLIGGLLIVSGFCLYYISIRIFEQRPLTQQIIHQLLTGLIVSNLLATLLAHNEYVSVIFNTALCVAISFGCALHLLRYSRYKRSLEYRFTGAFFIVFAGFSLYRLCVVALNTAQPVVHLNQWTWNEITFLVCMMSVLAINFGFILMVNQRLSELLAHSAGLDWLTGVMNRGNLEQVAEKMTLKSFKSNKSQAIILMDLDNFKNINDTYGHLFGDQVIQFFAELAKSNMREIDLLGRYGGEEFCVVMPITTEQQALHVAERIRYKFESTPILFNNTPVYCTVSMGICDSYRVGKDFKSMFSAADQSLYAAKKAGRNKVFLYSSL